jgi:hypothetical protein
MRISILGGGSEGDLRPLVALALRFRREGLVLTPVDGTDSAPLWALEGVPFSTVPAKMDIDLPALAREAEGEALRS